MNERQLNLKDLLFGALILVLVILFFSTQTFFGTENYALVYKLQFFLVLIYIGILALHNKGILKFTYEEVYLYMIIVMPTILGLLFSVIEMAWKKEISFHILKNNSIYQLLIILAAILCYKIFRGKIVTAIYYASIINYLVYVIYCVINYGVLSLLSAGSDNIPSMILEVHEVTFIFGLLLIYYIIQMMQGVKEKQKVVVCCLLCLLGFKRILLAGLLVGFVFLLGFRNKKLKPIVISGITVIALCLFWVALCSTDTLRLIANSMNIDFMGRLDLYSMVRPYYKVAINYIGGGIGYTGEIIAQNALHGRYLNLHNDVLKYYIDLGFIPFCIYWNAILIYTPIKIYNKVGGFSSLSYFVIWLITIIGYATDNLSTYPNYIFVLFSVLLCICGNIQQNTIDNNNVVMQKRYKY